MFPGADYRLLAILLASLVLFLTNVAPPSRGPPRAPQSGWLFGADVLAVAAMYAYGPRFSGAKVSPSTLRCIHSEPRS